VADKEGKVTTEAMEAGWRTAGWKGYEKLSARADDPFAFPALAQNM